VDAAYNPSDEKRRSRIAVGVFRCVAVKFGRDQNPFFFCLVFLSVHCRWGWREEGECVTYCAIVAC